MAVTKKEKYRSKLLESMSDPNNEMPTREAMSKEILGFKQRQQINKVFSVEELHEIEQEALENRRRKYASIIAKVDNALMERAQQGDPQAIKLVYQKFEGWSEKQQHEHAGKGGGPVKTEKRVIVEFVSPDDN